MFSGIFVCGFASCSRYRFNDKRLIVTGIKGSSTRPYERLSIEKLATAPVSALQGVTDADVEHLRVAFGFKTVRVLFLA